MPIPGGIIPGNGNIGIGEGGLVPDAAAAAAPGGGAPIMAGKDWSQEVYSFCIMVACSARRACKISLCHGEELSIEKQMRRKACEVDQQQPCSHSQVLPWQGLPCSAERYALR
jgi:hypothetical protein